MKVLSFGIYSTKPEYPRINNLMLSIQSRDIEVSECRFQMSSTFENRIKAVRSLSGATRFILSLITSYLFLAVKYFKTPRVDAILVGYPALFHIPLVRFLKIFKNRKANIINDVFFSVHDAVVQDRKIIKEGSFTGKFLFHIERIGFLLSDVLLIDTNTHASYLANEFRIPRDKFHRVVVGSSFTPSTGQRRIKPKNGTLHVLFIGTYIPLHGIDTILRAAALLKHQDEVDFTLVGGGQLKDEMLRLANQLDLPNVHFLDWVSHENLQEIIKQHQICLGIFGTTQKAQNVIPIKIFDICAAGLPLITADTAAIRELFKHGVNAYLVNKGDPNQLAQAVMHLTKEPEFRTVLADGASDTYNRMMSNEAIGFTVENILKGKIEH